MHLNCLKKVMQASKLVKGHLNNSDQSTFVYDTMHYAQQLQCCCTYTLMLNTFRKHARTSSSKNGREIPFPDNETLVNFNDHCQIVVVFCFFFYRNSDVILRYWFWMYSNICCSWCSIHCSGFGLADLKILIWLDFFRWQPAIWKKFLFSFLLKFSV